MAGKFQWKAFAAVNLDDVFFDSLKSDYPEFTDWFKKKVKNNEQALVFNDELGIGAFLYLKNESEPIELTTKILPAIPRLKIGTLRLAERFRGLRLGEGALGVSLWRWQEKQVPQIYATVFEKHHELIMLFERFGFQCIGFNNRGERVYLKDRRKINYLDPYKAFPFIIPSFRTAGVIPINDTFHDKLFPYSELKGNKVEIEEETAGNGITKIFIGTPYISMHYCPNEPVGIYRRFTGHGSKQYKSVITSFCTIINVTTVKDKNRAYISLSKFIEIAGNKTLFTADELENIYNSNPNIVVLELIYNGYFGKGHNVTYRELKDNNLFAAHPYQITYTKEDFLKILEMGDVNVQNVVIN